MKPRLQKLWDETVPQGGACPQPRPREVLRRVRAGLDGEEAPVRRRRILRRAVVAAAAAVLLTLSGMAVAANHGGLPDFNVLGEFFFRGEVDEMAAGLVNSEPVSVSDENYILTVTSSVADQNDVYFTLTIQGKTPHAREVLADTKVMEIASGWSETGDFMNLHDMMEEDGGLWYFQPNWYRISSFSIEFKEYEPETGSRQVSVSISTGFGLRREMAVRFDDMAEGLWLRFPVKLLSPVKRTINAEGQGSGSQEYAAGNTVYLKKVILTPLSVRTKYRTDVKRPGTPVLYYLWKDGHISTSGELNAVFPSGSGGGDCDYSYQFGSVQDISQMEAILFEGMAYPLDGGKPYAMDTSTLPRPFDIPMRDMMLDTGNTPLFALCDGLGADYTWDEETGIAEATYRGVKLTYTLGSDILQIEGSSVRQIELDVPPVYLDGELWVDVPLNLWQVSTYPAFEELWGDVDEHDGMSRFSRWLVYP